uniref:peptidylprolyl isomerase n=1 Tax=Alexandrium monilatum TaxID=311494 RepID=A0A7S4VZ82_9DINO|mmetsp:Transcript_31282/g.93152  ORF Transcript_31282/g.93152 Transcript_31282/m.93152 type:complete len:201 (-) Transcript_31282:40-642(-)
MLPKSCFLLCVLLLSLVEANAAAEGEQVEKPKRPRDPRHSPSAPNNRIPEPLTDAEGLAFLEKKGKEEGVTTLHTRLLYKPLKHGQGAHHPSPYSTVKVFHRASLPNGTEIGTSGFGEEAVPLTTQPYKLVKGWSWLLQDMVEGDRWEMYLPAEYAYGAEGEAAVPPHSALIVECELLEVEGVSKLPRSVRAHETANAEL